MLNLKRLTIKDKGMGIKQIFLLTDSNVPAYNFYKKNGFSEEQTTRPMVKRLGV